MLQTLDSIRRTPAKTFARLSDTAQNARKRFLDTASLIQAEKTPFDVIYQEDIVKVRYYPPLKESHIMVDGELVAVAQKTHRVPLVLVAPLAVNMFIYDLFPDRSLVKYLRAKGFELYLIDWGKPDWHHNHYTLSTYFAEWMPRLLAEVRQHSGQQQLSLHGWSLGGLFSTCYTALGDKDILNLALIGAPGDYHANGALGKQYQRISRQLNWLDQRMGWRVHNTKKRWWRSPGWANSLAFKLTNPVGSVQGYVDLLRNLHKEDYVVAHATNGAFLDDMVAYPGAVIQDIVQYLWADNVLARGELPMSDPKNRSLKAIQASMIAVCGKQDPIVTRDCTAALLQHVSGTDKQMQDVVGGHMGILSGSKAPAHVWPMVADWLAARSA